MEAQKCFNENRHQFTAHYRFLFVGPMHNEKQIH
jgi:hypothetical protein